MNELTPKPADKPDQTRRYALCIDGSRYYLSGKEREICEVLLRTNMNYAEAARAVNVKYKRKHLGTTIKKWVNRNRLLTRYMEERLDKDAEVANFSEEDWKLLGIQVLKGTKRLDRIQSQLWRDYGSMVVNRDQHGSVNQTNIQIRFGEKE